MAGVFGDRGRGGILRILCAAGAGDHSRKRHARHNRAYYTDRAASGNGSAEPGIPSFEINNHVAVAAGPGGGRKDGSVHRAVGQKRNSYVHLKTGFTLRDGFEMHIAVSFLRDEQESGFVKD